MQAKLKDEHGTNWVKREVRDPLQNRMKTLRFEKFWFKYPDYYYDLIKDMTCLEFKDVPVTVTEEKKTQAAVAQKAEEPKTDSEPVKDKTPKLKK